MSARGRWALTVLAVVAGAGFVFGASVGENDDPEAAGDDGRPNFVVVVTDDQTAESMRAMDRVRSVIGGRGTTFETSYVNFPLCCPSRSTLLTGQYAHNHRVLGNKEPAGGFAVFEELHGDSNLATWMQAGGYHTVHVGKYFNGYGDDDPAFVPPGWDEWYASTTPGQRLYDYRLNENGKLVSYGSEPEDFKEDVLSTHAVEVIGREAGAGEPLYLSVAYTAPHDGGPNPSPQPPADCANAPKPAPRHATAFDAEPLPVPPSLNELDTSDKPGSTGRLPPLTASEIEQLTRRYRCTLESLLAVDDGVAEIVDALREADELDDTYVIYTSDNGLFFGEHRIPSGKVRHYEEASRVPLLIRGPGVRRDVVVRRPVINADLAPTILGAAGVEPGLEPDGVSLLPVLEGEGALPKRDLLLETRDYTGIRSGRWAYVEFGRSGENELYDLVDDPYELENIAADPAHAGLVERLSARLAELADCGGESCHSPEPADG